MATFSDDFNRADTGTNGGLGSDWTAKFQYLEIASNKVKASSGSAGNLIYYVATSVATFTADQEAQLVVSSLTQNDRVSPMVRVSGSNAGYSLFCDGFSADSNRRLARITDTSAFTTIGTVNIVPSNGDTIKIRAVGSTISAYINGVLVDSATDSTYTTGQPGLMMRPSGGNIARMDDFYATDVTSGLTITSVTPSSFDSGIAGIVIAGSGFGASQGSSTVDIGGQAQTVTAWSNTSITITSARGSNSMGAGQLKVTIR